MKFFRDAWVPSVGFHPPAPACRVLPLAGGAAASAGGLRGSRGARAGPFGVIDAAGRNLSRQMGVIRQAPWAHAANGPRGRGPMLRRRRTLECWASGLAGCGETRQAGPAFRQRFRSGKAQTVSGRFGRRAVIRSPENPHLIKDFPATSFPGTRGALLETARTGGSHGRNRSDRLECRGGPRLAGTRERAGSGPHDQHAPEAAGRGRSWPS